MLRAQPEIAGAESDPRRDDDPLPRRWIVFAVVGVALLMASIDQTAVATALPSIQSELGAPLSWSSWTITIYALGQIISMPIAGRLSDQFGRKNVFLLAIGAFTVMSLCAGMAGNIGVLIVVRFLQGLAGGALVPAATGIVAEQFGRNRDRAVGMFTSIFPIGAIIGPIVGGVLVSYTSWRAIFLINLPLGAALVVLVALLIRSSREPAAPGRAGRVDTRGITLLCGTLLSTMTVLTALGTAGDPRVRFGTAGVAAAVAVIVGWRFLRHARRDPHAVVPIRLLRGRTFGSMNLINVLFGAAALGFGALVPLYAENRYGILPLAAGGLLAVRAVGMISTSSLSVFLLRRTGHRILMLAGFGLMVVGMGLLALPPLGGMPVQAWLSLAAGVTGIGMGMAAPASNNAALHLAPGEISSIAGLRGMFRQTGAIVSISATTAILSTSAAPGITQAYVFIVFAVLLLATIPLILLMPDHRGSW